MILLAIDPGPTDSAWIRRDIHTGAVHGFGKEPTETVIERVRGSRDDALALEMIASYGMPVGAEVFDTCVWIGRMYEAWELTRKSQQLEPVLIYRKDVKLHLCGVTNAKDPNIRQALIDRYGPGKEKAIGLKATPGPLYGVAADVWAALAVSVYAGDVVLRPTAS